MRDPIVRLILTLAFLMGSVGVGTAQERPGVRHWSAPAPIDTEVPAERLLGACDSDWDGGALGAALGAATGIGLTAVVHDGCGEGLCGVGALLGGVAGLWAGVAIDSRGCDETPARRSATPGARSSRP